MIEVVGGDLRVHLAVRVIESRYADAAFSLADLACEMNVSVSHASRLIRLQLGVGFLDLLHTTRIQRAAALLDRTLLTVKEIAATVGYRHTNELIRHFRNHHGITPRMYRHRQSRATVGDD